MTLQIVFLISISIDSANAPRCGFRRNRKGLYTRGFNSPDLCKRGIKSERELNDHRSELGKMS